jgi:predicted transcriptional regulator
MTISLPGVDWDGGRRKPLLVMSLQPQYWPMFLDGSKCYEYRRAFRTDAVQAYIYLSSPRKAICGLVDFGTPIIGTPERIAGLSEQHHPGSRQGMLAYLEGKAHGFAIPILSCREISPISLECLKAEFGFTAPENYLVLDNHPRLRDYLILAVKGFTG